MTRDKIARLLIIGAVGLVSVNLLSGVALGQSNPAGLMLQAQREVSSTIPAGQTAQVDGVQGTTPSDSASLFWVDIRAVAYVSAGSVVTTCQLSIADTRFRSPPVTVPANSTVAVPLEGYGYAWRGQPLLILFSAQAGPGPLTIQPWSSITAEVIPAN